MAARHGQHPQTRHGVRPYGRIRLVLHGAAGGRIQIRLAGEKHRFGGQTRAKSHSLHPQRHPAHLAHAQASRNSNDRRARPRHGSRQPRARRLELARLSRIRRQNRHRAGQEIRKRSARMGLADRQRTQPLRPPLLLFHRRHDQVPPLAAGKIRHHRPPESGLGRRLLVHHVPELRSDRHPQSRHLGRRSQPARPPRFQTLVRPRNRRLYQNASRHSSPLHQESMDHHQLHDHA